ncbi:MAG: NADH-quinone oxidoreductase subunit NuoN [Burkholderiaceae bacterium]|nr:NADH-quinone oxidoreductase subunit NuoN [Burkholderiaceae bacterium]MCD8518144.1 NADH-quinone oxidoreductase subunit NuoN [Burkholderiaceae bacterium]MCD8537732.1 NADH-quinone oxidoreductase subunit NuoN [Burkholderiaceae bacterium]MCD8564309.1 NADH-quinone oxidoreductase subunit NuoN [Burkholderiaceae bacterium]
MMESQFNFALVLPEIVLLVAAMAILLIDAFSNDPRRTLAYALSNATLVLVFVLSAWQWMNGVSGTGFYSMVVVDNLSHFLKLVSYVAVFATLVYGREYIQSRDMLRGGEFYVLVLLALLGQMVMISAGNLMAIYLGLELMSLAMYALVALRRDHERSTEAAMKYFVLGSLASGFLLYGMSMVYGATGSLDLSVIGARVESGGMEMALVFGLVFLVSGLAFKLGAVPFHMWVPDVYSGAPTAVTLVLAAAPKLAAFAITLRLLVTGLGDLTIDWQPMLTILAVLSLVVGNLTAIMQSNFKRMLAYSTIAHMGFVLLGLASGSTEGSLQVNASAYGSSLFYMVTYVLTTLGSFGVIMLMSREGFECETIEDLKGLNRKSPLLAGVLLVIMFSLAGIPPLVGFYAKLMVLQAVIQSGMVWLAVLAVIFSLIGAFYYLRVVKVVYFDEPSPDQIQVHGVATVPASMLTVNVVLILLLGILPGGLMDMCINAILTSF